MRRKTAKPAPTPVKPTAATFASTVAQAVAMLRLPLEDLDLGTAPPALRPALQRARDAVAALIAADDAVAVAELVVEARDTAEKIEAGQEVDGIRVYLMLTGLADAAEQGGAR